MQLYLIYRHDSSQTVAGRITDQLMHRYRSATLTRDIIGLSPQDYAQRVKTAMQPCDVVLVIIGPEWSRAIAPSGMRWQDDPFDPIAIEIATALHQGKLIVPLLVHGATMPASSELPAALSPFVLRQGIVVRGDPAFQDDMQKVYAQLNTQLTWRPASWPLLGGAIVLFVALFIFELVLVGVTSQSLHAHFTKGFALSIIVSLILWIVAFFATLAGSFILTMQRKQRGWLIGLLALMMLGVVTFPFGLLYFWLFAYAIVVGVFALVGKRREMM